MTIQAEQLDRIELVIEGVEGGRRGEGARTIEGALRVGDRLAPLPIGARIDPETGTFTWNPGVGFYGTYDLVLGGHDVRIVPNAQGTNRVGPQVAIDSPLPAGASTEAGLPPRGGSHASGDEGLVASAFRRKEDPLVAGGAVDLDSTVDSGVDAIHVWAYPAAGGAPVLVGAADYGGARPDVAAILGARFLRSGFGLKVQGLAPGAYDLAVFPYSTVRGEFAPAGVVRVTVR